MKTKLTLRDLFWLVLVVGLALGCAWWHPATLAQSEDVPKEEVEGLVAQLVSPNTAPGIAGPNADYPDNFDHAAQRKVKAAWFKLYRLGPEAFPYLIQHLDDKRYSFTEDNGFVEENWTVGRACSDIIACHLKPYGYYNSSGPVDGGKRWYRPAFPVPRTVKTATEWWAKNKDRSLREMQIESIEWVIREYAKHPELDSNGDKLHLEEMLAKLKASDKPLKPSFPFAK